jgi:putative glutamine amidotransferase
MPSMPLIGVSIKRIRPGMMDDQLLAVRPSYPHAVARGGGLPALIPLHLDDRTLRAFYDRMDGIVLSGGGDVHPDTYRAARSPYTTGIIEERDRTELQLARWAVEDDKPLLAICRGLQILNVALGGTLIQDILDEVPNAMRHESPNDNYDRIMHQVDVILGSKVYAALGDQAHLGVNSLHHQALKEVAAPLEITACAPDGIIEGVEHPDRRFVVGVQWHPEAMVDQHPPMLRLFESLTRAASG